MSVTSSADSGPGTLRDVILNSSDYEITFAVSKVEITSPIIINRPLTIVGPVDIMSNGSSNAFIVQPGISLSLDRIMLSGFNSSSYISATGSINDTTELRLLSCEFRGCDGQSIIDAFDSNVFILTCQFIDNNTQNIIRCRGIVDGSRSLQILGTTMRINSCQHILFMDSANSVLDYQMNCQIVNTNFLDNTLTGNMCEISFNTDNTSVTVNVQRCKIENNKGQIGSSFYIDNTSVNTIDIVDSVWSNNEQTCITVESEQTESRFLNINNCLFEEGVAAIDVDLVTEGSVTITNSTIMNHVSNNDSAYASAGISLLGESFASRIENVTIHNNVGVTNGGIILDIENSPSNRLINITATSNTGSSGDLHVPFGTPPILSNCIITSIDGTVSSLSNNNLIGSIDNTIGIVDGVNGNIVTTDMKLGTIGYYGGDNNLPVIPLLEDSPAIKAGNNSDSNMTWDARGSPFLRIYPGATDGGIIDIGAFQLQPFNNACFLGESLVKVKINGKEDIIPASQVTSHHQVFDLATNSYIPVVYNACIQGIKTIYKIPKEHYDLTDDLYITSGHPVLINGKTIKTRNVEHAKKIKIERSDVYTIVCDTWTPIWINGIGVYAWSKQKWLDRVKDTGLVWSDVPYFTYDLLNQ